VRVNYWEIIADNLSKAGWSWGCVSAVDSKGRTIWIADAHRDDGKRFVVCADEKLTALLELEAAIWKRTVGPSARVYTLAEKDEAPYVTATFEHGAVFVLLSDTQMNGRYEALIYVVKIRPIAKGSA
jgi:hypothetical protein